jgi:hypothetical protein
MVTWSLLGEMAPLGMVFPQTLRRADPDADGFPQSGVIGRLHGRRFCPQVDGSNRAEFLADSGASCMTASKPSTGDPLKRRCALVKLLIL